MSYLSARSLEEGVAGLMEGVLGWFFIGSLLEELPVGLGEVFGHDGDGDGDGDDVRWRW